MIRPTNVGTIYSVSTKTVKNVETLPKNIARAAITESAGGVPVLVYRKATMELLENINKQAENQSAARGTILGWCFGPAVDRLRKCADQTKPVGPSGVGKSALLLQAADHYVQNNWIVLYFPDSES